MDDRSFVFTWSALFVVTACCCLSFAGVIRLVDGHFPRLLVVIGIAAAVLAVLNIVVRLLAAWLDKKKGQVTVPGSNN